MSKSEELATVDSPITEVEVLLYLKNPELVDVGSFEEDPEAVRARIEAQQIGAGSLEELLGESSVVAGKQYVGKPFQLLSVSWRKSDFDGGEGLPFYALLEGATYDGERLTLSCGARSVVTKVAVMAARGWLPAWVKITEGKATEAGYKPLDLASAPAPFGD